MRLHNSTRYNYTAVINGREFDFKKDEIIEFECSNSTKVKLICREKGSVHLDWISIICLQMLFGSSTITNLYTDYSFVIENDSPHSIEIKYNDWSPRDQININSCFADVDVTNEEYTFPQLSKVKEKHKFFHLFISNALPLGIICLILCFFTDPPILFIILFLVWLLMFEIPSLKELKRFKQIINSDYINKKLCEYADKSRAQGVVLKEDTSKTGKIVEKIIGKMFKFDEDKK